MIETNNKVAYHTFVLANGLKVIVHESPNIAKVAVNILYKVGSRDELPHRTGFAHLFEHLMFRGSRHVPDYDTHVQRIGGTNNAFTTHDLTNYYISCPANQLETALWLESDRMLELSLDQEKLTAELSVVCEEFKYRYLSQPYGDAYLNLLPLTFQAHSYQWPVIGKELAHIEATTLDEVRDFFFRYYAPNNATLVVAGDVKTADVEALVQKWFGPIPQRKVDKAPLPVEPKQEQARSATLHRPVPHPAIYKMYHLPAHIDADYAAADFVTDLLSSGKSTRFYQQLIKEKQVASRASAGSWGLLDKGIASMEMLVAENKSVEELEAAYAELMDNFVSSLNNEEMTRIKTKINSQNTFQRTEVMHKAMMMAIYEYVGDVDLINTLTDHYLNLTVADIQQAFETYFRPTNCSTLYYLPQS
jgi:zinc protease